VYFSVDMSMILTFVCYVYLISVEFRYELFTVLAFKQSVLHVIFYSSFFK
jgi:hypothetical protein